MKASDVWFHVLTVDEAPQVVLGFRWFDEERGELFAHLHVPLANFQLDCLLTQGPIPCVSGKIKQPTPETRGEYVESTRNELRLWLDRDELGTIRLKVVDLISRHEFSVVFPGHGLFTGFFSELCQSRSPRGFCSLPDLTKFLVGEA